MKKLVIGGLGLLGIFTIGVFGYILFSDSRSDATHVPVTPDRASEAPVVTKQDPVVGEGTLLSLLTQALPLECMITYLDQENTAVTGTYFVAGGSVRGDFLVAIQGNTTVSSVIITDETLYSWSEIDGAYYGMKANLTAVTAEADVSYPDVNTPIPLDTTVQYDCQPWVVVDGSVFVPPADVLFQDYSSLMKRGMETPTSFTTPDTDQCALCDMVPAGEGQDECRQAFSCRES